MKEIERGASLFKRQKGAQTNTLRLGAAYLLFLLLSPQWMNPSVSLTFHPEALQELQLR